MWMYQNVSREEFELRKNRIEEIMIICGAVPTRYCAPKKVTSIYNTCSDSFVSSRTVYEFKRAFFCVDEVLFPQKPFIVIEWADNIEDVLKDVMVDADPFPYDLPDDEIIKEVRFILGN